MRGCVNVLGAVGLKLREAISALEARMTGAERAISSSTASQGRPDGIATLDANGKLKAEQKPAYTPDEVRAVPITRKVNNKPLSGDITLSPADVGAAAASHTHTRGQITDFPGSLPASDVYPWAKAATKPTYTPGEVGALSTTGGTVSGDLKLTGNLTLKGSNNFGTKINLGDSDFVHIAEPEDDCLEIKAKKINFVISDTSTQKITINGTPLKDSVGAAAAGHTHNGSEIIVDNGIVETTLYTIMRNFTVLRLDYGLVSVDNINDVSFKHTYVTHIHGDEATSIGLPANWWYIVSLSYRGAGYGAQIAIGMNAKNQMMLRTANQTDWRPWVELLTSEHAKSAYYAGTSAPSDKTQLWIDTTATTGGLKYWNGSAWVHVPVAYT